MRDRSVQPGPKPDGYTVVLAPLSTLVMHPQLNDLPYKTPDDFACTTSATASEPPR